MSLFTMMNEWFLSPDLVFVLIHARPLVLHSERKFCTDPDPLSPSMFSCVSRRVSIASVLTSSWVCIGSREPAMTPIQMPCGVEDPYEVRTFMCCFASLSSASCILSFGSVLACQENLRNVIVSSPFLPKCDCFRRKAI